MSYNTESGTNTVFGWVPDKHLKVEQPWTTNTIATFKDEYSIRNGPEPMTPITSFNEIDVSSATGVGVATNGSVKAQSYDMAPLGQVNPTLLSEPPSDFSLWLGPGSEPDVSQRILYLGDSPVADGIGIRADPAQQEHVMVFKDNTGSYCYPGAGGQTEAILDQALQLGAFLRLGSKDTVIPGTEQGNTIYSEGDLPMDRINAGNFPIIRSLATAASTSGGGLTAGKIAVFANSDGDIMPQLEKQAMDPEDPEYDPEYPNDVETTEMEGPLEVTNPNQNPDTPALKVCQNTDTSPSTLDICNEGNGGGQITFPGEPGNEPSIQSIPDSVTPAGLSLMTPVVGGTPIAAIAVPPVLAAGVAGSIPVLGAAAAAAGAGGGLAGIAAAAGALAGVSAGAAAVVGIGGIVAAPVVALTTVTGLPAMPKGAITLDPNTLDILNGTVPLLGWEPNVSLPQGQTIPTTKDGEIPTTKDNEIPTSPDPLGPNDPKTVGEPDPTKPASIKVPELVVESTTTPTTLTLAGPCSKEGSLVWDCDTGTMKLVITDQTGPTTTVVQEWTETTTTINNPSLDTPLLVTDGVTLSPSIVNPGTANTLWLDDVDTSRPKFGSEFLALASDISGGGVTSDTNPIANELCVYADVSGNRKTADAPVTLGRPLTVSNSTGGNILTVSGPTNGMTQMLFYNTQPGQSGTGLTFGQPLVGGTSRTWSFNSGTTTNTFWLWKNSGAFTGNVLEVNDAGIVNGPSGFSSKRFNLTAQSSNPGGANTLWLDSADTTRPKFGATSMALSSDLKTDTNPVENELVLYAASGNKKTNGASSVATLGGWGLQTKNIHFTPGNIDPSTTNTTLFVDNNNKLRFSTYFAAMITDVDAAINALKSNFTLTPQASNPGGQTTLWASNLDSGLMYGDSAVVNIDTLVTLMGIEEWTGNWSLQTDTSISPTNIPVTVTKVRNQVVVKMLTSNLSITASGTEGDPSQLIRVTVGSMPTSLYPSSDMSISLAGIASVSYLAGPTEGFIRLNWVSSLNHFDITLIQPGDLFQMRMNCITYLA